MMKMKRQKAKWSAVLTSAAMLMINIPVSAEEQSQYINGVTQINGYTEFEQPQVIENQDMAQLGYSDIRAYEIENAGELAWFVQHFYAGDLETQNVSLADNIDMSALAAYSWTPLGYYNVETQTGKSYDGVFDGNGYSISNIILNQINGVDLVSKVSEEQAAVLGTQPIENIAQNALAGVFGYIGSVPVVIMQGRVHYYEGYPMSDVVLPIRLMGLLGAKKLILTNAAGGINFDYRPGDFMLLKDHITTAVPSPLIGENIEELGPRFPDMSEVYSERMREIAIFCAKKLEIPIQEGVYVQFTGPNYETPAEIRMARSWGADAAGMSTACEAMAARHLGMEVCGISCITNLAAGMSKQALSHKEVQETADKVSVRFKALITELIQAI